MSDLRCGDVVVFLVGPPGHEERMEGSISKLSRGSTVFHAMFQGPMREKDQFVRIEDSDSRGFSALISWIHESKLNLRSVCTALSLLYLAHKYMVPKLITPILQYIIDNVNEDSVLVTVQTLILYHRPPTLPSAPPPDSSPTEHTYLSRDHQELVERCISICLSVVDQSSSRVLDSEEWEDVSSEVVELILSRSTLSVKSELEVVRAVERWGDVQARRQAVQRVHVLGDLVYLIRFLTMSASEFKRGVVGHRLLDPQEEQSVLFCLVRPGAWLPPNLDSVRSIISTPRKFKPKNKCFWTGKKRRQSKPNCDMNERHFTVLEKVFLCLACIFD